MKILSFGEILWDMIRGKAYIGGAPFNLASHLAKMGVQSAFISSVGQDAMGKAALHIAQEYGIDTRYITIHPFLPTGKVEVSLNEQGHPKYIIHDNTAWDQIFLEEKMKNSMLEENWDAISFGTLAQRTKSNRDLLYDLIEKLHSHHIFYDVNLRQGFYQKEWIEHSLRISTIVKLNDEEAVILSNLLLGKVLDRKDFCQAIISQYSLKIICITLGENGSMVYDGIDYYHVPGIKVEVDDTVGAGDGYSAAFLYSFLSGASLKESALFANQVGGYVASQAGAVPEYSPVLKKRIRSFRGTHKG